MTDVMFVARRPQNMGQRQGIPPYFMCLFDLGNAYRAVERTLSSRVSVSVKGASLSHLLFNMFFTAVLKVALASFGLDSEIVEDMVIMHWRSTGAGAKDCCGAWEAEGISREMWRSILCENGAGIVSLSPGRVRQTVGVIMKVRTAFGPTASEVKNEAIFLHGKGMPTVQFSIRQVYTNKRTSVCTVYILFTYPLETITDAPDNIFVAIAR